MMSVVISKKTKAKFFETKGSIKIKTKESLILRIHDIVEALRDFVARPENRSSVPSVCELDHFFYTKGITFSCNYGFL